MSRAGGNSGKGSRNYRLNWKDWPDVSTFGDWKLRPDERGLHWYVGIGDGESGVTAR